MTASRIVVFLLVAGSITASMHRYLWARLVRDVPWSPGTARALTVFLVAMALVSGLFPPMSRSLPRAVARPIAFVGYTWLGVAFLGVALLAVADLARAVALAASPASFDEARRSLFSKATAAFAGFGAAILGGVGVVTVATGARVRKIDVAIAKLPRSMDGFKIVQLTDIHVGPTIGRGFVEELVSKVAALAPDVIAITGDLVDGSVEALREHVAPLADLRAKQGVFFVTGNHEYYSGVDAWIAELRRIGVRVLRNERVELRGKDGADAIDLAGIDDASAHGNGHGPDLEKAVRGRDPNRPLVLLAHQPKQIADAERHGVALQLSGHTHGGQIWPFSLAVLLQQPFVQGLHRRGDVQIYVSPGTGYWGPPMRVGTQCEITEITLRVG